MPVKYQPLTDEEKEEARQKFEYYMEKFNAYFEKNNLPLLNYDEEKQKFEERLNSEEMVARYRIGKEIEEKEALYKAASRKASEGIPSHKNDFLARSFKFFYKIDGSPESEKYNRELYQSYVNNHDEFVHNRIKNLMHFDITKLIDLNDDPVKLMEFYSENMGLCLEANEFGDCFSTEGFNAPKELREAKESMKGMIQKINYCSQYVKGTNGIEFFAMPNISKESAESIRLHGREVFGKDKQSKTFNSLIFKLSGKEEGTLTIKEYFNKLQEKGMKVDKNIFLKYKVVETNPETKEEKEVSMEDFLNGKPNVTFKERTKEEVTKINEISVAFRGRYSNEFQNRMADKIGNAYNLENIESNMKGNFFARIFRRPSNEFKEYMQALKDYTNPKKDGYLDKENLTKKAQAYLNHIYKGGKSLENMNGTRQRRANLVINTMSVVSDMQNDDMKIRGQINREINDLVPAEFGFPKDQAVAPEEVNDFVLVEKNNAIDLSIESEELNKTI